MDMPLKNTFVGYNLMHNIVIMDSESTNRQFIARYLETPPRTGHDDHVPERSPWSACQENTCLGVQSHAQLCDHGSGVHESAVIARILDSSPKWSSRPRPQRVTMVDDAIYEFCRRDLLIKSMCNLNQFNLKTLYVPCARHKECNRQ